VSTQQISNGALCGVNRLRQWGPFFHTVSRYTCQRNFIHAQKRRKAFKALILMKFAQILKSIMCISVIHSNRHVAVESTDTNSLTPQVNCGSYCAYYHDIKKTQQIFVDIFCIHFFPPNSIKNVEIRAKFRLRPPPPSEKYAFHCTDLRHWVQIFNTKFHRNRSRGYGKCKN
jgi:hypothetical protein